MQRLDKKTALITGGAKGIGKVAVARFAAEGAKVAFVDIDNKAGSELEKELSTQNLEVSFFCCDVSKSNDVQGIISEIKGRYGSLHVIYNNASIYLDGQDGIITDITEEIWDKVLAVNLKSIYLFCRFGIPLMIESGGGVVINTASSAGLIGIPRCDAYTATKGATVSLTKSMAVEYGPKGIRVNCIAPAAIVTPMLAQSNQDGPLFDEQHFLRLRTPLRRYGKPEEVVNLAVFLASDEASYINGAIIPAEGGITISGDLARMEGDEA